MYLQRYTNFLKLIIRNQKALQAAIMDARAELLKNKGEYAERDKQRPAKPTERLAIKKATQLRKVCILLPDGGWLTVHRPEKWVEVINSVYAAYDAKRIDELLHEHFDEGKSLDLLAGLYGISRQTANDYRREFVADTALLAALHGLLHRGPQKR